MTDREQKASRRKPAAGATAVLEPPRPPPASEPGLAPAWEEFFRQASPAQQYQVLTLARRQGVIYAHQLPAPTNGDSSLPGDTVRWNALNHLLAGHKNDLDPVAETTFDPVDVGLDGEQRL